MEPTGHPGSAAPARHSGLIGERGFKSVEQYRLERGGVFLGVITRGEWDGQQASWHDWGWLEPAPNSEAALALLEEEDRHLDEATRLELTGGDPGELLAMAARLQAEFMAPGVVLVSQADGTRSVLDELHIQEGLVYWK